VLDVLTREVVEWLARLKCPSKEDRDLARMVPACRE
jgi:hypothetical protein